MTARGLIRAWVFLLALTAAATLVSLLGGTMAPRLAGVGILVACWLKARIILSDYLDLRRAPEWRRGFDLLTGLVVAVLAGLFLAG